MADPIRFVKEIGLWAFSRGRKTCRWQTEWCARYCYNKKFYRVNPKLGEIDKADELYWQEAGDKGIVKRIHALEVDRFRFAVRGEIWQDIMDVITVRKILEGCPNTLFWIPTRAWRVTPMAHSIEEQIMTMPNARVLASIDPSVSEYTERALKRLRWSTVFAGDNSDPRQLLLGTNGCVEKRTAQHMKCTKTWEHDVGACAICETGCFRRERTDVHLRQHK